MTLAVRENELRVEYLGGSVRRAMAINFVLAAFCGGLGGALVVMSLGHIEPNFSYWTTSGEFVFVAILAGWQSVAAVFVASTVLEIVRSFSSLVLPEHLAARARPVPAVRDPLPAARHRLAVDRRAPAERDPADASRDERAAAARDGVEQALRRASSPPPTSRSTSRAGERVSLIGSNGAGKTTFVNMITGYLKPDAGRIQLDGRDITPLAPRAITRLGVARSFQIPQLYGDLTVLDNMLVANACHDQRLTLLAAGAAAPRRSSAPRRCSSASASASTASAASPSCPAACASCSTSRWR